MLCQYAVPPLSNVVIIKNNSFHSLFLAYTNSYLVFVLPQFDKTHRHATQSFKHLFSYSKKLSDVSFRTFVVFCYERVATMPHTKKYSLARWTTAVLTKLTSCHKFSFAYSKWRRTESKNWVKVIL